MSYQSGYVVTVLVNGQVVDEHNKTVHLAEGQEYGLRLRNKTDKDAVAQIFIDGENVSEGGYIIRAHQTTDILRHSHIDRAFKLVSHLRKQAQEEGKDELRSNSGTIEVRWFREKDREPVYKLNYLQIIESTPKKWRDPYQTRSMFSHSMGKEELTSGLMMNCCSTPGVTVEGSQTGQSFNVGHLDVETNYVSVFLYLKLIRGYNNFSASIDNGPDLYCTNCGKKIGRSANYCSICGRPVGA